MDIGDEEEEHIDMEDAKGMLNLWIKEPKTVRMIKRSFTRFLRDYVDESGNNVYISKINEMCSNNKQTLIVDYEHLSQITPTLALWVADEPACIFPVLNEVAHILVMELYQSYGNIFTEIFVRISNLPISDTLRKLRHQHLGKLIKVSGVVTRRTNVFPQLKIMVFFCQKCGEKKGPIYQNSVNEVGVGNCGAC
jgi:DNA replication licensing factor MCM2